MQEMVSKGEGTPKAMAEVNVAGKNSPESRWCRNLRSDNDNLPKLPNRDDKMKPDSPTCAIDADEIIMMGKMELEKGKRETVIKHKDGSHRHQGAFGAVLAPAAPDHDDSLLVPALLQDPPPSQTGTQRSEIRVEENLLSAKVAPAASLLELLTPEPPAQPALTAAFAPLLSPTHSPAPASTRTIAAALTPSPASPANPLGDSNFLLLAEFAHVVRDTLALRGIQVSRYPSLKTPSNSIVLMNIFSRVMYGRTRAL